MVSRRDLLRGAGAAAMLSAEPALGWGLFGSKEKKPAFEPVSIDMVVAIDDIPGDRMSESFYAKDAELRAVDGATVHREGGPLWDSVIDNVNEFYEGILVVNPLFTSDDAHLPMPIPLSVGVRYWTHEQYLDNAPTISLFGMASRLRVLPKELRQAWKDSTTETLTAMRDKPEMRERLVDRLRGNFDFGRCGGSTNYVAPALQNYNLQLSLAEYSGGSWPLADAIHVFSDGQSRNGPSLLNRLIPRTYDPESQNDRWVNYYSTVLAHELGHKASLPHPPLDTRERANFMLSGGMDSNVERHFNVEMNRQQRIRMQNVLGAQRELYLAHFAPQPGYEHASAR